MALHHIKNVRSLLKKIYKALSPGGIFGIADLDKEDGGFHNGPARTDVKHFGFDRNSLEKDLKKAGFRNLKFTIAYKARRENGKYPIFLMTGEK
jgi:predicted methyltransferase